MNVLGHEKMIWEGHSQQQCIISAKGIIVHHWQIIGTDIRGTTLVIVGGAQASICGYQE
jgi:hypothetical protein